MEKLLLLCIYSYVSIFIKWRKFKEGDKKGGEIARKTLLKLNHVSYVTVIKLLRKTEHIKVILELVIEYAHTIALVD